MRRRLERLSHGRTGQGEPLYLMKQEVDIQVVQTQQRALQTTTLLVTLLMHLAQKPTQVILVLEWLLQLQNH